VERVYTFTGVLTRSGVVFRKVVPDGYKLILLDLAAHRPVDPAQAYLNVERDDRPALERLDLYCMQGLPWSIGVRREYMLRIYSVDKMEVTLDVKVSGTYRVRGVYGVGKLTIPEKIKLGLDLSPWEEEVAGQLDLHSKVEAGVV